MLHDPLADALSTMKNAEKVGKTDCVVRASKVVKAVLGILQKSGYVGAFEYVEDGRGGKYRVELLGKIVDCNAIKPKFSVKTDEFEKWEKRFLPAREVGMLMMTTPKGIMDHKRAKELNVGGKLLAYVY
jgi:small subunit ribosomal protein S8